MVFLCFLLILTGLVPMRYAASSQQVNRLPWMQYIDAMYAVCISHRDAMVSMKMTTLLRCLIVQREYLQCDILAPSFENTLQTSGRGSSGLEAPCGLIHLSNNSEDVRATRQWTITVYSQLYLNVTFLELVLPMPYARCDRYQGSEILLVRHRRPTLNQSFKDALFLCGEHSPFSMVWNSSNLLLIYTRKTSTTQVGHFRIQYQVCDQKATTRKVQTVRHVLTQQSDELFWLKLSTFSFYESGSKHVIYTVHLLGSRLTLLDVLFVFQGTSKQHVHVDAFDGPGPAELHRRRVEHEVLDSEWIFFDTFQAFLRITCKKNYCRGIFIKYGWQFALVNAYKMLISEDHNLTNKEITSFCSHAQHWYCLFQVETRLLENVEISLQVVNFFGPDYLGGFNEPSNCLLAGVTIVDGYRAAFWKKNNSLFNSFGDIPKSLPLDSVLPEITTCFKVPLETDDKVVWDFPINRFVSYGQTLILAIYAYGAYVDTSKFEVEVAIRPSYSAGLIVSCPIIPADGYLGIGTASFSGSAAILHGKQLFCPLGNVLFIMLVSLKAERLKELPSEVIFCTIHQERITRILIVPHLSDQAAPGAVRSLFVQINSYTAEMGVDCYVTVEDPSHYSSIDYKLNAQLPKILDVLGYSVAAAGLTSDLDYFGEANQLTGRYVSLNVFLFATYVRVKINATLPCAEAVELFGKSNKSINRYVDSGRSFSCQSYTISLWKNRKDLDSTTNTTYLMYLASPQFLKVFKLVIKQKARMGRLTTLNFNWEISKFLCVVNISLHPVCSPFCQHAKVEIVYKTLVSRKIVYLEWNLILTPGGFQITLSDMPVFETLLYITPLKDECLQEVCSANIAIQEDAKANHRLNIWDSRDLDQTPFAEYHLLWTHEAYTSKEAENICQQLGGLHLASIATQKEYLLLSRMLLGSAYYVMDTNNFRLPVLSPCLMGSPLCVIYVGMRRQNTNFSWSDGRPTGYLRWNVNYFTGHGPNSIKYYSETNDTKNSPFAQLLKEARSILQPQYTNGTLCTVLIGSPGPHDMEFVSIPCDRKLQVSGIMCIQGGNELKRDRPLYRLTHLKLKARDSQLVTNATDSFFNVDMLFEAFFEGKLSSENQGSLDLPVYYEQFNEETYSKLYAFQRHQIQQTWTESIQSCNNSVNNISLCNVLRSYNETSTNKIQNLTTNLFLTSHDQNDNITSLSIHMLNGSMLASNYCRPGGVFDGKQCIHVLQKPIANEPLTLRQLCLQFSNEGKVYVPSTAGNLFTLSSILQRLDISSGKVSCHNRRGNAVALHFKEGNLDFRVYEEVNTTTKYVVCSLQPVQPTCPPAYVSCDSGCISDRFLCDGRVDCESGEDELNCTRLCGVVEATSRQCFTTCSLGSCTCHELYFQCLSGDCIHSSKLCNGDADCVNAEDESFCFGLMPTLPDIVRAKDFLHLDTANDFIPDQVDSLDEKTYISLLRSVKREAAETCNSVDLIPCVKGHPACYPIDKMCLYDHTQDGRLKYCRNGLHLLECENIKCSGSFKCRYSYCVPTHKVCNGVQDCPYGDDEIMCPVLTCINMLRCGRTCVHPSAICDGSVQCESREDELACGAPKCPSTCQCSGYAMKCQAFMTFDSSFKRLTMFILRHPELQLVKGVFRHVTNLLILDVSHCNVTSISTNGPFAELHVLVKLDLSHNSILLLSHGSLNGLSNLLQLDMSWNPLSHLEPGAFVYTSKLRVLSLQHCHLRVVSDLFLPNTDSLDTLDMSFGGSMNIGCLSFTVALFNLTKTTLWYDKYGSNRCWENVNQVISDQRGICCLVFLRGKCSDGWNSNTRMCPSLFPSRIVFVYCWVLIMVIVICNLCVFIYKLLTHSTDALLLCNLALANTFSVVPLCVFIYWQSLYDTEFAFFEPLLSRSALCRMLGDVFIAGTQIANFFQMLISLQKYYGIVSACNIVSQYKLFFYLIIPTFWLASALVCSLLRFKDVHEAQTTTMLDGLFFFYRHKYSAWPAFLILTMIFALTAIFSYGQILKYIYERRITHIGVKHGKDIISSSIKRVTVLFLLSIASILAVMFLTTWLCLTTTEAPQAVALVVLIFPLQSVFNPFLFTLSTQRFVKDCRQCFSLVIERLNNTVISQ